MGGIVLDSALQKLYGLLQLLQRHGLADSPGDAWSTSRLRDENTPHTRRRTDGAGVGHVCQQAEFSLLPGAAGMVNCGCNYAVVMKSGV